MSIKRVLLIIGGGIAAYKALELVRLLVKSGIEVQPVLTDAGAEFVTPLSLAVLAGRPVYRDLFQLEAEAKISHISLARAADLVVVAPATADLMAKTALGLAGDLATTLLLATDKKILMAPAANVRMWQHPATQRNLAQLQSDGVLFIGPEDGDMACGEFGQGRMSEPETLFQAIVTELFGQSSNKILEAQPKDTLGNTTKPLSGRKVVVTAGPTWESIDPIRYIANRSSGRQGYAIAKSLYDLGAEVVLISGPVTLDCPFGVQRLMVETAEDMFTAVENQLPADVAILTAAVADWRPRIVRDQKWKKSQVKIWETEQMITLHLIENKDILAHISKAGPKRPKLVIGFAAETENLIEAAKVKLAHKACDIIIANDVSGDALGGTDNEVVVIGQDFLETWPRQTKLQIGEKIAKLTAERLSKTFERNGSKP